MARSDEGYYSNVKVRKENVEGKEATAQTGMKPTGRKQLTYNN